MVKYDRSRRETPVMTDAKGIARFTLEKPGTYLAVAQKEGFKTTGKTTTAAPDSENRVYLYLEEIEPETPPWAKPARVTGQVIGIYSDRRPPTPVAGARIVWTLRGLMKSTSASGKQFEVTTDSHGRYAISLPKGIYSAQVHGSDRTFSIPSPVEVKVVEDQVTQNFQLRQPQPVVPVAPTKPSSLLVSVYRGGIRGEVALSGVAVTVRLQGGSIRDMVRGTTDRSGTVRLSLPKPGVYEVSARTLRYGDTTETVTVSAGQEASVRLTLKDTSTDTTPTPSPTPNPSPTLPSFDPCNKPGWIHCTRLMTVPKLRDDPTKSTVFMAEFWLKPSGSTLSGTGEYYYLKDFGDTGFKGTATFSLQGSISGDRVTVQGPDHMTLDSFGYAKRDSVSQYIPEYLSKFSGTMSGNVYSNGPVNQGEEQITTKIQRCTGSDDPPTQGSFAGRWNVALYDKPYDQLRRGDLPTNTVPWDVRVSGNTASTQDQVGRPISGPLSSGGRVWNAKLTMGSQVIQEFRDMKLSSNGDTFIGGWGGAVYHGYAIIGTRSGGKPTLPDSSDSHMPHLPIGPLDTLIKPPLPITPTIPHLPLTPIQPGPSGAKAVVVTLDSKGQSSREVVVQRGGVLTVRLSQSAGTGLKWKPVSAASSTVTLLGGGEWTPATSAGSALRELPGIGGGIRVPGGRPGGSPVPIGHGGAGSIIAGQGGYVEYRYRINSNATEGTLKFELGAPWSRTPSGTATLQIRIGR